MSFNIDNKSQIRLLIKKDLATTTFAKKKTCIRPKHACKGATIIKFKQ
jgi:hypothetical protein